MPSRINAEPGGDPGRRLRLMVCSGDGIGPEISRANCDVLEHLIQQESLPVEMLHRSVGFSALEQLGSTFPDELLEEARACDGIVLGPVSHLDYPCAQKGGRNPSGGFRIGLDLYANIRPALTRASVPAYTKEPMDLVIVRENTEGFYADRNMHLGNGEFMPTEDVALAIRKITLHNCQRIARSGFTLARRRRQKVTAVHKANVMKVTDGLFLKAVRQVASEFPDVVLEEILVDAMAAHLIRRPSDFDVIVTTNMFGDILSDEASQLAGGLGLAGSLNAGDEHAMAQAQHGSAPDIAGKNIANPTSLMLSTVMLLQWLGDRHNLLALNHAAGKLERAVEHCLQSPRTRTPDLDGALTTDAFAQAVNDQLSRV